MPNVVWWWLKIKKATTWVLLGHHQATFNVQGAQLWPKKSNLQTLVWSHNFAWSNSSSTFFCPKKKAQVRIFQGALNPKKKQERKIEKEKNLSCNLGPKSNSNYNLGFLRHHQAILDTESCLVMAKNIKNPNYNSIFIFPLPNNSMEKQNSNYSSSFWCYSNCSTMEKQRPNLSSTFFCPKNPKANSNLPMRLQPMRKNK